MRASFSSWHHSTSRTEFPQSPTAFSSLAHRFPTCQNESRTPSPTQVEVSLPIVGRRQRLDALHERLDALRPRNIGYPCNQDFDYEDLFPFLSYSINNVGDPFGSSNYRLNTQDFEREVVTEFARMTHAPANGWWGYVTAGGTEGNMYGLYVARELFPDGICYFSEDTHYSVAKILRLQHTRNIMLKSQPNGDGLQRPSRNPAHPP
ncbi:hypothetical protein [Verrucomicrobium spinosum]|uniref:hypothetical protein n=1 Tax=Verrucomicrobium spinosum TaxID=2736 RepID=UPI000AADFAB5|nr:hypothetical protein [Verrucomicrobium spinosum]